MAAPTNGQNNILEFRSVAVEGKLVSWTNEAWVHLEPHSESISISFGPGSNASRIPLRLRHKLDGYDNSWHEDGGQMCLIARYFDKTNNQIGQTQFFVSGSSPDWREGLSDSSLNHRRETVTVPPSASRLMIVIASTGAPSTIGVYALTDLAVSRVYTNRPPEVLLQFPPDYVPVNWVRDGLHPTMAQIMEVGKDATARKAFVIFDNDLRAHAEWHNTIESSPEVKPGDQIVIEWNEMYNIADGLDRVAYYGNLPPGQYHFQAAELNVVGMPTGVEISLPVLVLQPIWKRPWFLVVNFIGFSAVIMGGVYYVTRRRMRRQISRLENQRALEHERLRIARDIHDDLGARVTQISLASAMAQHGSMNLEQARADFEQISQMSRDLVTALYETVWVVSPANDNLKELGNYIFQIANKMCAKTQCHCRFYVDDLPEEITISSHVRHNICMAVKEALNNVIKHANASEVAIRIAYKEKLLTISIQDNGSGFDPAKKFAGAGLANLKRRLNDIGGACNIQSQFGQGTTIDLSLTITPTGK